MPNFLSEPADPAILETLPESRQEQIATMSRALLLQGRLQRQINDRAAAATGLAHMHYALLLALSTTDCSRMSDLADYYSLDVSVVSRHVSAMESAGYVSRTRDESDRRAVSVQITPEGSDVLERTRVLYRTRLAQLTKDWDEGELDTFASFLCRLLRSAGGIEMTK